MRAFFAMLMETVRTLAKPNKAKMPSTGTVASKVVVFTTSSWIFNLCGDWYQFFRFQNRPALRTVGLRGASCPEYDDMTPLTEKRRMLTTWNIIPGDTIIGPIYTRHDEDATNSWTTQILPNHSLIKTFQISNEFWSRFSPSSLITRSAISMDSSTDSTPSKAEQILYSSLKPPMMSSLKVRAFP